MSAQERLAVSFTVEEWGGLLGYEVVEHLRQSAADRPAEGRPAFIDGYLRAEVTRHLQAVQV